MHAHLIVVTGGTGLLGTQIIKKLVGENVPVVGLYNKTLPAFSHPLLQWEQCNLSSLEDCKRVLNDARVIINTAAIVSFDAADADNMITTNCKIVENIIQSTINNFNLRLIHISSVAALGREDNFTPQYISEENISNSKDGQSVYGQSKYLSEQIIWQAIKNGLHAVILQPSIILAEGNWDNSSGALIKMADKEFPFYTKGVNGFVDAQDIAELCFRLINTPAIRGESFIVNGGNFTYQFIFSQLAIALGKKPPKYHAPKFIAELIWRISVLKHRLRKERPTLTKETARTAYQQCFYNNQKVLSTFSDFQFTPLEQTASRIAAIYRQESVKK